MDNRERQQEQQAGGAYQCSCGTLFPVADVKEFRAHLMRASLADGKGTHKSMGLVNSDSGEILIAPRPMLTVEQKALLQESEKQDGGDSSAGKDSGDNGSGKSKGSDKIKELRANVLSEAQQIRVIPRVYTMDYSPIMRAAQDAASKYWGWRAEMPLGNFLDTCLFMFFEEKGITLCGYIVDDSLLQKEEQHAG